MISKEGSESNRILPQNFCRPSGLVVASIPILQRRKLRPSEGQGLSKIIWLLHYGSPLHVMALWGCSEESRITLIHLPNPPLFPQVRGREAPVEMILASSEQAGPAPGTRTKE